MRKIFNRQVMFLIPTLLVLVLSCILCYKNGQQSTYYESLVNYKKIKRLIEKDNQNNNDVNLELAKFDEKISGLNKRFDDFYILGGVIVTLLIAMMAGLFIKTEHEIEKHFKDNFESYSERIKDIMTESEQTLASLQSKLELDQRKPKDNQTQT
jgi:uncharacterized protein YneF (UPF0154 family)